MCERFTFNGSACDDARGGGRCGLAALSGREADWRQPSRGGRRVMPRVVDLLKRDARCRAGAQRLCRPGLRQRRMRAIDMCRVASMRCPSPLLKAGWGGHAPFETWFDDASTMPFGVGRHVLSPACRASSANLRLGAVISTAFYAKVRELAKTRPATTDALCLPGCLVMPGPMGGINAIDPPARTPAARTAPSAIRTVTCVKCHKPRASYKEESIETRSPMANTMRDGQQPLCEALQTTAFIDSSDVLRRLWFRTRDRFAPRSDLEHTQCLTAD